MVVLINFTIGNFDSHDVPQITNFRINMYTQSKGGSNETLDNLEQECGTYFQFFLRPPLLLDKKVFAPPLTNGQKKVDPPNSKKMTHDKHNAIVDFI